MIPRRSQSERAHSHARTGLRRFAASLVALGMAALFGLPACSLLNQEGPEVTCEALLCGKINACREGIIAQCADGVTVKYHVCGTSDVCKEAWQKEGQFRCTAEATDCEGCRPERNGCDDVPTTSSTGTSSSTGGGAGGGSSSSTSSASSTGTGG